jgi:hemerythrin-like domain-containing protein
MDAIALLKQDHRTVKQLFREFEGLGNRAYVSKQRIVTQALQELEIHAALEEEIFYPAVDAKATKEGKKLVDEAVEEHHVVKVLMAELLALTPEDERFDAKFTVLIENVEHHIEEEETEMLPDAAKRLAGELDDLGGQLQRRKAALEAALTSGSPSA